jgi:hypothetical protein
MRKFLAVAGVMMVTVVHNLALSCPSCYGDVNSSETQGVQWAILALLGVTGSVLVGMSAFFLYLRKRALQLNRLFSDKLN